MSYNFRMRLFFKFVFLLVFVSCRDVSGYSTVKALLHSDFSVGDGLVSSSQNREGS